MRLPDPARSRAVLIGAARYRSMADLPAVAANLTRLADLLSDPRVWGLSPEHVTVVPEPESPGQALDQVRRAATAAGDTLLVYYAGHGLLDDDDNLLLALPGTDVRRPYTAIRFDDLRAQVRAASRGSARVVILDCCYSARAIAGGMGPDGTAADDLKRHAAVDGTYLMAAAAETKIAVAPPGETYTAFTGELIKVLEEGIDGSPELITVDQIFWQVRGELEAKGRPRPEQGTRNAGAAIVLSRNRAARHPGPAAAPPPPVVAPRVELPATIAAVIAAAARPGADADQLLHTAGAVKPDQQVAGLVLRLDDRDATRVLDGVATRPLPDIEAILDLLKSFGAAERVRLLLTRVAAGSPQRTVELVAALARTDAGLGTTLLDHAVAAAADRPHAVIDLVAGLSRRGMKDAADAVVAGAVTRLSGPAAVEVADALREVGRDADAVRLYVSALAEIAQRTPEQVAAVSAELLRQGLTGDAEELVTRAAGRSRRVRMLNALAADPALAGLRSGLMATLGASLGATERHALADELSASGGDPLDIYLAAAASGPVEVILGGLGNILDQDRPRDAARLVEWAATHRPADDLIRLSEGFTEPYRAGLLRRLLAGIPGAELAAFHERARERDEDLAAAALREMGTRPPAERLGLAAELAARNEIGLAAGLLNEHADPGALTGADRAHLLTALAPAPGTRDLQISLAVEQLRTDGPADWSLAAMPPEVIEAVAGAVNEEALWRYLSHRSGDECAVVLDTLPNPARMLSRLAGSEVNLVAEVLSGLQRTGRGRLGNQLAERYRAIASKGDAARVGSLLRHAGAEGVVQRFLEGRLWLPPSQAVDTVAVAVADYLHRVDLRGQTWRFPVDPAIRRELAGTGQLAMGETGLLVWQWAIAPVRERIVFTAEEVRPWGGRPVARIRNITEVDTHDRGLTVTSSRGSVMWNLDSMFLAPALRDVLLALRDLAREARA
ncbi:caspase, EACC1-associated type [Actinoplanes sp. G11-F43]|uniref:caspase, EACC1-associated type n=1 Tax=Actinoplanes sp. G11-F43 TaxID=3424130 RepID=UPI003D33C202